MTVPIRVRLTLWYVLLFALIVGAWSIFVVVLVRADLYSGVDRALASRATQIARAVESARPSRFSSITDATLAGVPKTEAAAQLVTPNGRVLEYSGDAIAAASITPPSVLSRAEKTGSAQLATVRLAGEKFRVLVVKLGATGNLLVVGMSTEAADSTLRRLMLVMLLTGPLALLAAGLGGWLLAGRALRPVSEIASAAAAISIEHLGERVAVPDGDDELTDLAVTLNGMLERLENGVRDKRQLVADASHELQTPLAVMRTELDVAIASEELQPEAIEVLASAREETDRMTRIVRNLLTLARFDEGTLRLLKEPVDLHEIALASAQSLATLAREHRTTVSVTGDAATVEADAEHLRLVVNNLIENAIRHPGADGVVVVETSAQVDRVVLTVRDNGEGIPAESLAHIFDRFFRTDASRTKTSGGSGLGLAICKEIVEAHGGTIEVSSSPGNGATFRVELPIAQDPANAPRT